jgi:hypothetical protein
MKPFIFPIRIYYDDPDQTAFFAGFIDGRYPTRWLGESKLMLTRSTLPESTELFILTHPSPVYLFSSSPFFPETDRED